MMLGTQYRSAIFYHDENQKNIAEKSKNELEEEGVFKDPIVTEITPFSNFYAAENYHKNYYENNRTVPYCKFVIDPKNTQTSTKIRKLNKTRILVIISRDIIACCSLSQNSSHQLSIP